MRLKAFTWLGVLLLGMQHCQGTLDHQQQAHEWLIGWKGESYMPPEPEEQAQAAPQQDTSSSSIAQGIPPPPPAASGPLHELDLSKQPNLNQRWVQVLSWQPRLLLHHNFLSAKECDDLVALRTASQAGAIVEQVDDEVLYTVEQKVANWTALPPYHIEGWQMQQGFEPAEQAALHVDLLTDRLGTEDFQRMRAATVVIFLSDVEPSGSRGRPGGGSDGWSLVFPGAQGGNWRGTTQPGSYLKLLDGGKEVHEQLVLAGLEAQQAQRRSEADMLELRPAHSNAEWCSTAQPGLALSGFRKGSALLIWNLLVDGQTPDPTAAHVACSPTFGSQGEASAPWVATTWLHNLPAGQDDALGLAAECVDRNPQCSSWAAQGFCDDAPGLMIGLRGICRYSCSDCNICKQPARGSSGVTSSSSNTAFPDEVEASQAAASAPGASTAEAANVPAGLFGSPSDAAAATAAGAQGSTAHAGVVAAGTMREYIECLYQNMHSLRQGWSAKAREAGVRKARNAIKRDLRAQAAMAAATGHGLQDESLMPVVMVR